MSTTIKGVCTFFAGAILAVGATPLAAQTIYDPQSVEITGSDISCADAFAAFPSFPKSPRVGLPYVELSITNPANSSGGVEEVYEESVDTYFRIDLLQDASDNSKFTLTDVSLPAPSTGEIGLTQSQITDIPGYEAVILQRNNHATVFYQVNMQGRTFDGPGTQTPTKIAVCWAIGPCGLTNQTAADNMCALYNPLGTDPETAVDVVKAFKDNHFDVTSNALSLCGCTSPVRYCDPAVPAGGVGSCNPNNENFDGIETTAAVTSGVGTLLSLFGTTGDGTATDSETDTAPTTEDPTGFTW